MNFSFCTNCRNRLADLQQTLGKNLEQLQDGEELVLLDYHSGDGLRDWVLQTCAAALVAGRLRLYSESTAPRFFMAHAKNVSHLLGRGRVLVNLDADNWLDPAYLRRLRQETNWGDVAMVYPANADNGGYKGRTAIRADVFRQLGGYDEAMNQGYGYEEVDLFKRLQAWPHPWSPVLIDPATAIPTPESQKAAGQQDPAQSIQETDRAHRKISLMNRAKRQLVANPGRRWGEAHLVDALGVEVHTGALTSLPSRGV